MRRVPDRSPGFTLLEVVVTLAILSLSLTVLYQVFTSVARGTRVSSDYYRAVEIAETQIALLAARRTPSGTASGIVDNYFHWQASVTRYEPPADSPVAIGREISDSQAGFRPYLLSVSVNWGGRSGRRLELNTVRLETER